MLHQRLDLRVRPHELHQKHNSMGIATALSLAERAAYGQIVHNDVLDEVWLHGRVSPSDTRNTNSSAASPCAARPKRCARDKRIDTHQIGILAQ